MAVNLSKIRKWIVGAAVVVGFYNTCKMVKNGDTNRAIEEKIVKAAKQLHDSDDDVITFGDTKSKRVEYTLPGTTFLGISIPKSISDSSSSQLSGIQIYMKYALTQSSPPHLTWWCENNSQHLRDGTIRCKASDGPFRYRFDNWKDGDKFICEIHATDTSRS